jgi:adenylate cyclase
MRRKLPALILTASPWWLRGAAVVLAAVCVLALDGMAPGLRRNLEERTGDLVWRSGAVSGRADERERRFVVVDIDEASLAKVGPWPWPRERLAELSRQLAALGASAQVYDIVLPESRPGDAALAEEFGRHRVVLAEIFSLDPAAPAAVGQLQGALEAGAPPCGPPLPQATGFIANAPALARGGGLSAGHLSAGHITPRIAMDGAVRHLPALICFEGRAYPALGLAALASAAGAGPAWSLAAGSGWLDPAWRLAHEALPGVVVPLDDNGDVRLSYRLPRRAFASVSAADVLAGQAPGDLFRGAWVLVGATAFGIGDAVPTPHGGAVGGVEVHAQFISALLDGRLPHSPRAAPFLLLLLAVVAAAVLLLAAHWRRLPVLGSPLVGALLAAVLFVVHAWLLLGSQIWLGWSGPAAFSLLAGVLLAAAEHARARFERERLYGNLASYLPEPVAAEIAFREPSGAIEAERREVTVLFADIRNFSAYCEGRPPEEAAALLHAFFTAATRVVETHGGMVEEFTGDAVMAVWNAPRDCADHTARALDAARELELDVGRLFAQPPPPGLAPLALGIGIETGSALVGSFGPAHRRTHTAMGETVTIASRLQALTADLAQPILLGEGAASQLATDTVTSLGAFLLEGLRRSRLVYAPLPGNVQRLIPAGFRGAVARRARGA